ncbi:MAG: peptide chain release factor N(5)-glutamine methyltransferase [Candidatus Dormibacteraceae bacterium]
MTVLEVLKLAADHFHKHGSDSARLDAEILLAHSLDLRRLDLYLKFDRQLSELELSGYRALVAKRARGEPVAYLVGHKEFMGLDFIVTPAVLVPNPDTEVLVQRVVELARDAGRPLRVADVGTGSGCVAIAIAHYAQNVEVVASDVAQDALDIAAQNVAAHGLLDRVKLVCGDLMAPLTGSFDIVCANLPYLAAGAKLAPEVVAQPARALYAGEHGAALVTRLLEEAPGRLNARGLVLAELDPSIALSAVDAANRRFAGHRIHRDLAGHERVLEAWS